MVHVWSRAWAESDKYVGERKIITFRACHWVLKVQACFEVRKEKSHSGKLNETFSFEIHLTFKVKDLNYYLSLWKHLLPLLQHHVFVNKTLVTWHILALELYLTPLCNEHQVSSTCNRIPSARLLKFSLEAFGEVKVCALIEPFQVFEFPFLKPCRSWFWCVFCISAV